MGTRLQPVEFTVFRSRPAFGGRPLGEGHTVAVCVSGGRDSVAALEVLLALQPRWGFNLEIVHVHHGRSRSKQGEYRRRAQELVQRLGQRRGLPTTVLQTAGGGAVQTNSSEAALRERRLSALTQWQRQRQLAGATAIDAFVLAHHRDDVFETRLIRLLRGTGPQGLGAMAATATSESGLMLWRPFLSVERAALAAYLKSKKRRAGRDWLADPSNRDLRYLRNSVRHKLIPLLDQLRPGAAKAAARSLELLSAKQQVPAPGELRRQELLQLQQVSHELAGQRLAAWMLSQGMKGFSKNHVDEILKRLSSPRRKLQFSVGGRLWVIDETISLTLNAALQDGTSSPTAG